MSDDAVISDVGAADVQSVDVVSDVSAGAAAADVVVPEAVSAAQGDAAAVPEAVSAVVDYGLEADVSAPVAEAEDGAEDGEGFRFVWPEGAEVSDALAEVATGAARAVGLTGDGEKVGAFVVRALEAINERAAAVRAEADAQLKADWGEEYAANMQECKGFLTRMRDAAGLSAAEVEPLLNAGGFRLVKAMMGYVGERAAAGLRVPVDAGERSWAREAMRNPAHGDYAALHDVTNPRWREVNGRYNRAMGMGDF